ncbi:MAG: 50S ribosomal protein L9 [Caldilineaceae bacterium]|nr:50S ribosomal protein L9 [Caldilineaceae bacterium]
MARTKVLLTQDVANLGDAGNVFSVAAGYARNYLLPRGMAVLATKGALKQADMIKQAALRRRAQERAHAESQAQVISQQRLLFTANAGDNDRLYGSVTSQEIAEKLAAAVGFEIDRRRVLLDQPIRELGISALQMRLMPEVVATFTVGVVREGEGWEQAEARQAAKSAQQAASAAAEGEEAVAQESI